MRASVEINEPVPIKVERLCAFDIGVLVRHSYAGFGGNISEVPGPVVDQKVGLRGVLTARRRLLGKRVVGKECVEVAVVIEVGDDDGFSTASQFNGLALGIAERAGDFSERAIAVIQIHASDVGRMIGGIDAAIGVADDVGEAVVVQVG